ncbi:PPE family protein [Mycobacterium interjectum]|uniref:PPE family protein n=1 Tax=Mycobacterium interjectum TaxID=33895 RepID=UPI000831FB59|nr:PPE family protein [Mycobacterium interjectum]
MFYAAFPPEFNSGRMYTGPGSGSMRAAAAAWDGLATELQSTAASYSSVIDTLTSSPWVGPSSLAMAAAVAPYLTWMQGTAAQAAETATQATAAATAYEAAFAAHVPPVEIAANRTQLASLVATNVFGQNTPAIAATETQYAEMWAQDAVAMNSYAGSSSAATEVTPFTAAPQITNSGGIATQTAAVAAAAATPAGAAQSLVSEIVNPLTVGNPILAALAEVSTGYTSFFNNIVDSVLGPTWSTTIGQIYTALRTPLGYTTQYNWIGLAINLPVSQVLKFAPHPSALGAIPRDLLGGGLAAPHFGRGTLFSEVSGGMGNAGTLVGKLSVPPSWAANTPAVRMVASALSAGGAEAVPAAALGEGGLLSSMSVAGMLGSALGAGGPTVVANAGVRGRVKPIKDLKDAHSPEKLKRLVAQISEKPESVQHHTVDQEGLDSLLEQLAKKPGIHAVHLKKGDKATIVPSEAQSS